MTYTKPQIVAGKLDMESELKCGCYNADISGHWRSIGK